MTVDPYLVQENMPLLQLGELLQRTHHHSFPVVDEELNLVGMVSLRDYERVAARENSASLKVRDIATLGRLLTAYEDEPLSEIVQRLAVRGINKMPVVSRDEPRRVVGTIRRSDIVKAYLQPEDVLNVFVRRADEVQLRSFFAGSEVEQA